MNFKALIAGALMSAVAMAAQAAPVFFTNATGLTGTFNTVTFSEVTLAYDAVVTNEFPGITLNNAYYNPQDGYLARDYVGNFSFTRGTQFADMSISFNSTVNAAAFQLVTNGGTSSFSAYLAGNLVGSGSASTSTNVAYYGFTGGSFDKITIVAPGNAAMLVDNVQSGAVPEPATWAMMLLGFGVMGGALRASRRMRFAA